MKKLGTKFVDNYHSVLALIFGLISIIICINPYFLIRIYGGMTGHNACLFAGIPLISSGLAIVFGLYTEYINANEEKNIFYMFGLFGVIEGTFSIFFFFAWLASPFAMMT